METEHKKSVTINELLAAPKLTECRKVLCIQPHPDDNEVGMGGSIALLADRGCEIHYLTVTDGRLGDQNSSLTAKELAGVRQQEAEAAGRLLGATRFFWLGYADGSLQDVPRLAGELAEIMREGQYDSIFCPDPWLPYESHQDHVVTGRAAAQAAISCSLKQYPEGTGTAPCVLRMAGFYFTASPNQRVDVTAYFDRKFEAMGLHKTQMDQQLLALYRTYFTMRGNRLSGGTAIAEGIRTLRPLHMHCFPEALEIV